MSYTTVGQLIDALSTFDRDTPIACDGADCGGHDVTLCPEVSIELMEKHRLYVPKFNSEVRVTYPVLVLSGELRDDDDLNTVLTEKFADTLKQWEAADNSQYMTCPVCTYSGGFYLGETTCQTCGGEGVLKPRFLPHAFYGGKTLCGVCERPSKHELHRGTDA